MSVKDYVIGSEGITLSGTFRHGCSVTFSRNVQRKKEEKRGAEPPR